MNQKLRTARGVLVILFAVLCIVCLSLSLVLSAHFAAYAQVEKTAALEDVDGSGQPLWLVSYDGNEAGESLWDGIRGGRAISYLVQEQTAEGFDLNIVYGGDELSHFTPYRGKELTLKLNPAYVLENGSRLDALYDIEGATYEHNSETGSAEYSYVDLEAKVTAQPIDGSAATEALSLSKVWTIATLCNDVNHEGSYIGDRAYGQIADYELLRPVYGGDVVVYDISSAISSDITIAIRYSGNSMTFYQAIKDVNGYSMPENEEDWVEWDKADLDAAKSYGLDLINYMIFKLDALRYSNEQAKVGAYTLTVAALPVVNDGIPYAQGAYVCPFAVNPQSLGANEQSFGSVFNYEVSASTDYTGDATWIDNISFKLSLKTGIELEYGKDFTLTPDGNGVGRRSLTIVGNGNISGSYTLSSKVNITPSDNSWIKLPNIITWSYGTYKAENNLIIAQPRFVDNLNDITFRIVKLVEENGKTVEQAIDEYPVLSNLHYANSNTIENGNWIVADDAIAALQKLGAGNYRLYASVYGVGAVDSSMSSDEIRNYKPIAESSVDFTIFVGVNSWKSGAEPTVKDGGWIEGKLDSIEGVINAEPTLLDEGEKTILMIYKVTDKGDSLVYSNIHSADNDSGVATTLDVLKTLRAGRYYLSAEVKGTNNYSGLKTTVLFTVNPNNLPIWAVILIVAGSLGIVALVFGILHQKGILQMLTGKVIISMRTRANVDATLAAIRAAKVARDAEASIAAAKARDVEEQAKADKSEDK